MQCNDRAKYLARLNGFLHGYDTRQLWRTAPSTVILSTPVNSQHTHQAKQPSTCSNDLISSHNQQQSNKYIFQTNQRSIDLHRRGPCRHETGVIHAVATVQNTMTSFGAPPALVASTRNVLDFARTPVQPQINKKRINHHHENYQSERLLRLPACRLSHRGRPA
jgi:hypothetical protein